MSNWDWSSIWSSLLVPIGVIGGFLSIMREVINFILKMFFRKLEVEIEDLGFRAGEGINEVYWLDIRLLLKNKLDTNTTVNKINVELKHGIEQSKTIIMDIDKDKQERFKFDYFLGDDIPKSDGTVKVYHTYGMSSVKFKI